MKIIICSPPAITAILNNNPSVFNHLSVMDRLTMAQYKCCNLRLRIILYLEILIILIVKSFKVNTE